MVKGIILAQARQLRFGFVARTVLGRVYSSSYARRHWSNRACSLVEPRPPCELDARCSAGRRADEICSLIHVVLLHERRGAKEGDKRLDCLVSLVGAVRHREVLALLVGAGAALKGVPGCAYACLVYILTHLGAAGQKRSNSARISSSGGLRGDL